MGSFATVFDQLCCCYSLNVTKLITKPPPSPLTPTQTFHLYRAQIWINNTNLILVLLLILNTSSVDYCSLPHALRPSPGPVSNPFPPATIMNMLQKERKSPSSDAAVAFGCNINLYSGAKIVNGRSVLPSGGGRRGAPVKGLFRRSPCV